MDIDKSFESVKFNPYHSINIQLFDEQCLPEQQHSGEWADVKNSIDIKIYAGDRIAIPLGFAAKLPDGFEAILAPRSSTFKRYGLLQTNTPGVIDSAFCGPSDQWHWLVYATKDIEIPAYTRLAQFRIQNTQGKLNFNIVERLESKDRGGFGSTGK